ncbi:MAG: isopenicillin N synthase family oxygenase, partial [Pseudomonadota bacterium]
STEHRVLPVRGPQDRYSIAFFMDPDSDVMVRCLPEMIRDRPARYADTTAGAHIQRKILATHRA